MDLFLLGFNSYVLMNTDNIFKVTTILEAEQRLKKPKISRHSSENSESIDNYKTARSGHFV